jgi:signal transduction histidine kinase/DNA-binding response OmpR family regulator
MAPLKFKFKLPSRTAFAPTAAAVEPERIAQLLRSGFMLATVAVLADIAQSYLSNPARAHLTTYYDLIQLVACFAFGSLTYGRDFKSHWKVALFTFCLFVAAVATRSAVMLGEQVPLFITILLLTTATSAMVPWEAHWQDSLTVAFLAAAALVTARVHQPNSSIGLLWIAVLAGSVLARASNRLKTQASVEENESAVGPSPAADTRMQRLFDADLSQASLVQLRGGRFVFVNEELVANLSHQLRNSLNALMGMTDLLAESPLSPDQRAYVETMSTNGSMLVDLIDVILDLAKVESGKLRLEEKEFDVVEVVERVAVALRLQAHEKGLELLVRIRPEVPAKLIGDPQRLRQIVFNLLDNAIKFTEHGEVELMVEAERVRPRTVDLLFMVRDSGIGIAPDQLTTIFQTFAQGDSKIGREYGGSGLGLAIAKRLSELMGGQIKVSSERGAGSMFSFTASFELPVALPEPIVAAARRLKGAHILVIDDSDLNRLILREFLGAEGAELVETDKGSYALEELQRAREAGNPYNVVLLDGLMPAMDGFEVAQRIRSEGAAEAIIMMFTADDLEPKLARAKELGVDACVVKPVRHSELIQAIETASGKSDATEASGADAETPALSEPEPQAAVRPCRILLVDDSPHNRLLIKQYLKDLPYDIDMAENGEVALHKFLRRQYDLVLMDLRMPVMDGHMAVRRMRKWEQEQRRTPTPIVALSASALERDIRDSLETGCTSHLSKPVKKARLIALIRELTGADRPLSSDPRPAEPSHPATMNGHS